MMMMMNPVRLTLAVNRFVEFVCYVACMKCRIECMYCMKRGISQALQPSPVAMYQEVWLYAVWAFIS